MLFICVCFRDNIRLTGCSAVGQAGFVALISGLYRYKIVPVIGTVTTDNNGAVVVVYQHIVHDLMDQMYRYFDVSNHQILTLYQNFLDIVIISSSVFDFD